MQTLENNKTRMSMKKSSTNDKTLESTRKTALGWIVLHKNDDDEKAFVACRVAML